MTTSWVWLTVFRAPDCRACLVCDVTLPRPVAGDIVPALVADQELLGIACTRCLTREARAELALLCAEASAVRCRG